MSLLPKTAAVPCTDALTDFVAHAQLMLDPATPESVRRKAEPHMLAQLPTMHALGVFELFTIRDPALSALVHDELAAQKSGCHLSIVAGARSGHDETTKPNRATVQADAGCSAK